MERYKQLIILLSFIFLNGCVYITSSVPTNLPVLEPIPQGIYHTIETGQTLWRISQAYNIPLAEIIRANNITDVTQIKTGANIFIPGKDETLKIEPYKREKMRDKFEAFIWPVKGRITSFYGRRGRRRHYGIDIAVPIGKNISASRSGKITRAGRWGTYGKIVEIDHGDGYTTRYAHNSKILVKRGQWIKQGQVIAKSGSSGKSTGPHLHYEIRYNNKPENPVYFLP
ncbi:MAG: LysM peptidoglycan-binding domain-containing M23 family metallopeptidase [Candidatus Omnitrophota bacterium]